VAFTKTPQTNRGSPVRVNFVQVSDCHVDRGRKVDLAGGLVIFNTQPNDLGRHVHSRLAARVEGKSSLARLGLGIHVTAPTIHSGFAYPIRLEILNHGHAPIRLRSGMKICQLIFEATLGTAQKGFSPVQSAPLPPVE
jgi:hypothetical protein